MSLPAEKNVDGVGLDRLGLKSEFGEQFLRRIVRLDVNTDRTPGGLGLEALDDVCPDAAAAKFGQHVDVEYRDLAIRAVAFGEPARKPVVGNAPAPHDEEVRGVAGRDEGVRVAHGDATSGYSLYLQDGHLVHDLNVGGLHQLLRSDRPVPAGARRLGVQVEQGPLTTVQLPVGAPVQVPAWRRATLLVDGQPAGSAQHAHGFNSLISWSGLDIGLDRGSPVSLYAAPFAFTGELRKVIVTMDADQGLDGEAVGATEMARQ